METLEEINQQIAILDGEIEQLTTKIIDEWATLDVVEMKRLEEGIKNRKKELRKWIKKINSLD